MTVLDTRNGEATERLERATLGRQVADAVRRDILFGRLTPGTRLGQQQLCERFGVSRMPVRDALRQLMYEGLLVADEGRHSVVAKLSRSEIEDSFVIEGMLHGFAARRVTETATPEQLVELRDRHEAMVAAETNLELVADLNWQFHRRINQLAASRKLVAALRALALSIPRDYVVQLPEWAARANAEHAEILRAMEGRRGARVENLMRAHASEAGKDLVRYLEQHGVDLD